MLQCVTVCCSVLQCFAVFCSVLQCVAVCSSVLQCIATCCSVLQCVIASWRVLCTKRHTHIIVDSVSQKLQRVAVCCVAVCCRVAHGDGTVEEALKGPQLQSGPPLGPAADCPI